MYIVILGGSGFIGSALLKALVKRGDTVVVSSRSHCTSQVVHPNVTYVTWDGCSYDGLLKIVEGADAIVNLIGENIAAKRWTNLQKQKIVDSRVLSGKVLVDVLSKLNKKPSVLIQASAVGYYGLWDELDTALECVEKSPSGEGFLADTVVKWEDSTFDVERLGIRRCVIRTAPVLGIHGGVLKKMLPLFYIGLGSVLGTGKQPFPWIHIDDEVSTIVFLLDNTSLSGIFNLVAPEHITMQNFAQTLGYVLRRVVFLRIPKCVLHIVLGQMADELLLSGQKAYPKALLHHGFTFKYHSILLALKQLLR